MLNIKKIISNHFMKHISKLFCILLTIFCIGCTAKPNLINGKYYMAGDSDCRRYRTVSDSDSRIMCMNSDGGETGYRDAMTDQELYMYQSNQAQIQAENNNLAIQNAINKPIYCNHIGTQTFCN